MIGQLLTERYLILQALGKGGFSETFLARDKYLPHHPLCVVKCLKALPFEVARRMFDTEAQALQELGRQCEQIPLLLARFEVGDRAYLVQEYVEGENLEHWLEQGRRFSQKDAVWLLLDVLPILEFIHAQDLIHRDIKPSNLIRRTDGRIVLIDFGAAKWLNNDSAVIEEKQSPSDPTTEAIVTIGTPGYMPEEQQQGQADFSSDLYSLSVSVIQLLTGIHPRQLKKNLSSGEIEWESYLKTPLDSRLVTILNKLVRVNRKDRYRQASEVLADLQQLTKAPKPSSQWAKIRIPALSVSPRWAKAVGVLSLVTTVGFVGVWQFSVRGGQMSEAIASMLPISNQTKLTLKHDLVVENPVDLHTVSAIAVSPDGDLLAASKDQSLYLWNLRFGRLVQTLNDHQTQVAAVAFSPDAQMIAGGGDDQALKIWDVRTGKILQTFADLGAPMTAVVFAPTQQLVIGAVGERLQVWDLRTGELRKVFAGHKGKINHLLVSEDGRTLYSLGEDRAIAWSLDSGELLRVFPKESGMAMTGRVEKQHLVTVHSDGMRIWDQKTGVLSRVERDTSTHPLDMKTVRCADRYLVSSDSDQRFKVWEISMLRK